MPDERVTTQRTNERTKEGRKEGELGRKRERRNSYRERERALNSIRPETKNSGLCWIDTRISFLLPFTPALDNTVTAAKGSVNVNSTDNRLPSSHCPNWLNFQNSLIFMHSKFSISLVWCHITKLLRHLITIITSLLNFPCFHLYLSQTRDMTWIYFVYILVFLFKHDRCLLSYSLLHALNLSNLIYISTQKM